MSKEHEALSLSILEDASTVTGLIKMPNRPFCGGLQITAVDLLAKEDLIRACVQDKAEERQVPRDLSSHESIPAPALRGDGKVDFPPCTVQ